MSKTAWYLYKAQLTALGAMEGCIGKLDRCTKICKKLQDCKILRDLNFFAGRLEIKTDHMSKKLKPLHVKSNFVRMV
jgi:hypothetical protein